MSVCSSNSSSSGGGGCEDNVEDDDDSSNSSNTNNIICVLSIEHAYFVLNASIKQHLTVNRWLGATHSTDTHAHSNIAAYMQHQHKAINLFHYIFFSSLCFIHCFRRRKDIVINIYQQQSNISSKSVAHQFARSVPKTMEN